MFDYILVGISYLATGFACRGLYESLKDAKPDYVGASLALSVITLQGWITLINWNKQ